jgi:hypothetical protein
MTSLPVVTLFFAATAGHFVLVAAWLRSWQPALRRDVDELAFQAVVVGTGTFQAVLQALAFSVGLSLARGLIALAVVHGVAAYVTFRRARGGGAMGDQTRTGRAALAGVLRQHMVPLAGVVIVVALVVDWTIAAAGSLQVIGPDADHYHVPNAVNIALGVRAFGVPATPHIYPMGTSVFAAWFILPFRDPLLVDLAVVFPFLLAWVAIARLVRLLTGQPGLAWAPWIALLFFSTPLAQQSLFMSADLFYAAAFLALNALLLKASVRLEADRLDLIALALCVGMLVGTKVTGAFSAVVLFAVYLAALAVRWLLERRRVSLPGVSIWTVALAMVLVVASGGIWLLRNWWLSGSPIAPSGLWILGVQVFPGATYESGKYYASVLWDVRELPGYDLAARFAYWANHWLGRWFLPAGLATVVMLADIVGGFWNGRRFDDVRWARVIFAVATLVLLVVHLWVLAGVPWSSLEWYRGLSLRYLLPCCALYLVFGCVSLLPESWPWWRRRPVATSAALLLVAAGWYLAHQSGPGRPGDVLLGRLTLPALTIALGIVFSAVAVWRLRRPVLRACLAALLVLAVAGAAASHAATMDRVLVGAAEAQLAGARKTGATNTYQGVYLALLDYERAARKACSGRRFFMTTRFDAPLELQSPRYENEMFEMRSTFRPSLVRRDRPGSRPCDYIVASRSELDSVRGVLLINQLKTRARLGPVASFDQYVVYEVQDRETTK